MRHKPSKTRICWYNMISRCYRKKHHKYSIYGARGIKVCNRWLNFKDFLEDMGEKPEGKSIDRIDNHKGYSKSNCRWATHKEQNNNKRDVILFKGESARTASLRLNGERGLVSRRIKRGWDIKKAFTELPNHKSSLKN